MNRNRIGAAVATGLVASLLSVPGPAAAVPGLQRVVGATASTVTTSHTLVLTCPAGKVAVGAGASVIGSAVDTHIIGFWPEGNQATLTATSDRNPATAPWALQGLAICATSAPDFQFVISPLVADGATSAPCPVGKVVIGMGVRAAFGRINYAIPFGPGNGTQGLTSVTGAVTRLVSVVPSFIQTMAVCANASRASRLAKAQTVGTGPARSASVTCPAGTQLHAFGGYNHYPNQTQPASHALFTGFTSALAQPNLAVVASREKVDNIAPQTWGVDVWAICAP
jgi:hypothetical protein